MRLLLDECVHSRLRLSFPGHVCQTAMFAGLSGLANGTLLSAAESLGYDVLITVDQNVTSQQNLRGRKLSILVLCAVTNRYEDLLPLVPAALSVLTTMQPGQVVHVR